MIIGVNSREGLARINDVAYRMSPQQLLVLELLFDNRGKVVRYAQIENMIKPSILTTYPKQYGCKMPKTVAVIVCILRKRFKNIFLIDNVASDGSFAGTSSRYGVGYKLRVLWPERNAIKQAA